MDQSGPNLTKIDWSGWKWTEILGGSTGHSNNKVYTSALRYFRCVGIKQYITGWTQYIKPTSCLHSNGFNAGLELKSCITNSLYRKSLIMFSWQTNAEESKILSDKRLPSNLLRYNLTPSNHCLELRRAIHPLKYGDTSN